MEVPDVPVLLAQTAGVGCVENLRCLMKSATRFIVLHAGLGTILAIKMTMREQSVPNVMPLSGTLCGLDG